MLLNLNHVQPIISTLPKKGLSLGLRLTLSTMLIVSIVMGGVTYIQHTIDLKSQHVVHENLLRESLSPLVARIETSRTLESLKYDI